MPCGRSTKNTFIPFPTHQHIEQRTDKGRGNVLALIQFKDYKQAGKETRDHRRQGEQYIHRNPEPIQRCCDHGFKHTSIGLTPETRLRKTEMGHSCRAVPHQCLVVIHIHCAVPDQQETSVYENNKQQGDQHQTQRTTATEKSLLFLLFFPYCPLKKPLPNNIIAKTNPLCHHSARCPPAQNGNWS